MRDDLPSGTPSDRVPGTQDDADAAGHVLHGEAAEHPTGGGRPPSALPGADDADEDDTAGHVLHGEAAQDPTGGGRAPGYRSGALGGSDGPGV